VYSAIDRVSMFLQLVLYTFCMCFVTNH
jgi:hypothetical protein